MGITFNTIDIFLVKLESFNHFYECIFFHGSILIEIGNIGAKIGGQ